MPKILATSDLHGNLPPIPECDLLIVAGDVCPMDDHGVVYQREWLDMHFRRWLMDVPAEKVVGIAGNHDFVFEKDPAGVADLRLPWTYLEDSETLYEGLSLWGLPWVPNLPSWAFHASKEALADHYRGIPSATSIVISHGPPWGYGDFTSPRYGSLHVGCRSANDMLGRVKPKALICGHIHEGFGSYRYRGQHGSITDIYNVSFVDEHYTPRYYVDTEDWTGQPSPPGLKPEIVEITIDAVKDQDQTEPSGEVRIPVTYEGLDGESDQGSEPAVHAMAAGDDS